MGKKKLGLTHSQISGIIWITTVLAVIMLILFFSHGAPMAPSSSDSLFSFDTALLTKKEDSVYRSRRHLSSHRRNQHPEWSKEEEKADLYSHTPPAPTRRELTVELNSADSLTLQLLHGIGPAFARRIVRYRERLGGFHSTEQLLEVYGFTPQLLNHISPHLRLDTSSLRRIPVNSIKLKDLTKHPYVDYYFARDLVKLRSQGTFFNGPDDLRTIPSCNDSLITRLIPYLDFTPEKK